MITFKNYAFVQVNFNYSNIVPITSQRGNR